MTQLFSTPDTKKILFQFLLQEIEYRNECQNMQDLIAYSKENDVLQYTLGTFIEDAMVDHFSLSGIIENWSIHIFSIKF